ncbi:MAG: undecaprenyl-diphosphatase [Burkholderiales bacterium]|nr:undecaprenyl-diphosphatase [Burkholderiales bacterium]
MEYINHTLFLWLNAPAHPSALLLIIATFFAEYAIWMLPVIIGIGWLRGGELTRKNLLQATVSGLAGLLINQIIGLVWQHPRPFMIGLGHTLIPHAADSSFPSDHLTLLWAVAFSFLMHRTLCQAGLVLVLLGMPVAWARIYLGVHFPLDMVGAALVAVLSAWLALLGGSLYLPAIYAVALRIHQILFGKLIYIGWVRK